MRGATIPGAEFAPGGPSPLQQQAFGLAGQLPGQIGTAEEQFQPIADFARAGFQQETIPAIAGAAGFSGTARSSGFQDILARQGRNLELGLGAQFAGFQNQALNRQMQLPGQLAGIGGLQQAFPEAQRQFRLQQFQAGAPEADPRLGFIGPAFTSAFDTAIAPGQQGIGSSLIDVAGQIGAAVITKSDERCKENIIQIDDALEKVKALNGKTYNYKTNSPQNRDGGLIAQDIEKVLPEAVVEIDGIKYVKYEAIVALLVNAINELARKAA